MDISYWYGEQNRAFNEKARYEKKNKEIKEKIRRLKSAQSKVSAAKGQISSKRSEASRLSHVERWKGKRYQEYQEEISENLMSGFLVYEDKTDDILDKLRTKIARLENEARDVQGVLGEIANWINDITTAIINFVD